MQYQINISFDQESLEPIYNQGDSVALVKTPPVFRWGERLPQRPDYLEWTTCIEFEKVNCVPPDLRAFRPPFTGVDNSLVFMLWPCLF